MSKHQPASSQQPSVLQAQYDHWFSILTDTTIPRYEREYRFHPPRRFKFDCAWPQLMVAVEIEGGTWSGGRHTRPLGYTSDAVKYNLAVLDGWKILRFTTPMVEQDPEGCINQTVALLRQAIDNQV